MAEVAPRKADTAEFHRWGGLCLAGVTSITSLTSLTSIPSFTSLHGLLRYSGLSLGHLLSHFLGLRLLYQLLEQGF